ncbi:11515_t:CDS:2 [Acaulospora colombiana]|uniref:11515_t:CDS:1 n=1 Tax=Acaulospora colombiana TaxID=27376 RepID=A0ACA9NFT5_9GLOM|nr:11515_t:CDS:2 [Acaulospora colombiana]
MPSSSRFILSIPRSKSRGMWGPTQRGYETQTGTMLMSIDELIGCLYVASGIKHEWDVDDVVEDLFPYLWWKIRNTFSRME